MERLKELAENLSASIGNGISKREILEQIFEIIRILQVEKYHDQAAPENQNKSFEKNTSALNETTYLEVDADVNNETNSLYESLRVVEEDISASLNKSLIPSLKHAIGVNERYAYMENLFQNSLERFEKIIDQMDNAADYENAELILLTALNEQMPDDADPKLMNQLLALVKRRFSTK